MLKYLIIGVYLISAPVVVGYIYKTSRDLLRDAGKFGAAFILIFSALVSPALVVSAITSMWKYVKNKKKENQ